MIKKERTKEKERKKSMKETHQSLPRDIEKF